MAKRAEADRAAAAGDDVDMDAMEEVSNAIREAKLAKEELAAAEATASTQSPPTASPFPAVTPRTAAGLTVSESFLVAQRYGGRPGAPLPIPEGDALGAVPVESGGDSDSDGGVSFGTRPSVHPQPSPRGDLGGEGGAGDQLAEEEEEEPKEWTGIMARMGLKVMELSSVAVAWAAAMGSRNINDYLVHLQSQRRRQLLEARVLQARLRQRVRGSHVARFRPNTRLSLLSLGLPHRSTLHRFSRRWRCCWFNCQRQCKWSFVAV